MVLTDNIGKVRDLQCRDWSEQYNSVQELTVDVYKRIKDLPIPLDRIVF